MNNLLLQDNKIDSQLEELSKIGRAVELIKQVWSEIKQLKEVISQSQNIAIEANEKADKALAINDTGQMYLNQTELGQLYKPSMSNKTVGNILRLIGWAKITMTGRTTPYERVQKLRAKMLDYQYYRWHKNKFKEDLEEWLKDEGLWEEFDNHIGKKQRQIFFKKLHEERIG